MLTVTGRKRHASAHSRECRRQVGARCHSRYTSNPIRTAARSPTQLTLDNSSSPSESRRARQSARVLRAD